MAFNRLRANPHVQVPGPVRTSVVEQVEEVGRQLGRASADRALRVERGLLQREPPPRPRAGARARPRSASGARAGRGRRSGPSGRGRGCSTRSAGPACAPEEWPARPASRADASARRRRTAPPRGATKRAPRSQARGSRSQSQSRRLAVEVVEADARALHEDWGGLYFTRSSSSINSVSWRKAASFGPSTQCIAGDIRLETRRGLLSKPPRERNGCRLPPPPARLRETGRRARLSGCHLSRVPAHDRW